MSYHIEVLRSLALSTEIELLLLQTEAAAERSGVLLRPAKLMDQLIHCLREMKNEHGTSFDPFDVSGGRLAPVGNQMTVLNQLVDRNRSIGQQLKELKAEKLEMDRLMEQHRLERE